jgi:SAM-dependent methyltransferase
MPQLTLDLLDGLAKNGPTDPIEFYRRPLVGYLFRERINMGLRLLGDRKYPRVMEVGYGAGAVLLALAPCAGELHGVDLDADPGQVMDRLASSGYESDLKKGSVYELPYEDASFDLVVCYSVFEHLHEYPKALSEVARVLKKGGRFLLGMPAVNKAMEWGFLAIGFKGIEDHHVTPPARVASRFADHGFEVIETKKLGLPLPLATLYTVWLLERT